MSQIRTSNDGHLARHSAHFELLAKVARLTVIPEVARLNPWEREMSKSKVLMLLATLGVLATVPSIKADEWNQKTEFTFSGPVEVPGQVPPAGTLRVQGGFAVESEYRSGFQPGPDQELR
jgi:hypothetical protein